MQIPVELAAPPAEFSLMPFWFWNDDLDREEILRQMTDFERHGVSGFVIHPRVGLPRSLPWMSPALLDFYEFAIAEAARRGFKVILYDEAMYPSGSSCGQVVAANPAFRCRGLAAVELPEHHRLVLAPGENLVARVAGFNDRHVAVFDRPIDSVIRGVHYIDEGPGEDEPPAGDILNPDAVDKFIELVYDGFAARLEPYFGSTVIGIFTDEPSLLGRCRSPEVRPGTTGILTEVNRILGYDFTPFLPALWSDRVPQAEKHRAEYRRALLIRLEETYYTRLQRWCERHHLALMGHPEGPDHIGALRFCDPPRQDVVWRWVLPDTPSALDGEQSTQAKCSSSAMAHLGRRRNLNEYCGAYGHEMTWDEMNWLSDWCLVRGVNQLIPHAFFYSVRGVRRDERPPDVGPHAVWWDRYRSYADRCRRLCWLNTDSRQLCRVAILGDSYHLPWAAAKWCFQHQYDFNYLEEKLLGNAAAVTADGVDIRDFHYEVVLADGPVSAAAEAALAPLGARLVRFSADAGFSLPEWCPPTVKVTPSAPALRVRHLVKADCHWFLLFNEEAPELDLEVEWPVTGERREFNAAAGTLTPLDAERSLHWLPHQLRVFCIVPPAVH